MKDQTVFGRADQFHLRELCALWQEAFGDTVQDVLTFFRAFPECLSFGAWQGGRLAAMVHALPQILRGQEDIPAAYVYAVATAKDFRGQGLCSRLMGFAEQELAKEGFSCTVLTPGEPSLFRFYEKLGYETAFTRSRTAFSGGEEISLKEYAVLRERVLTVPHMVYDENALAYAQRIYGLRFYQTAAGCAAASDAYAAECLPEDLGGEPFAMVKWLDKARQIKGAYLGLALE